MIGRVLVACRSLDAELSHSGPQGTRLHPKELGSSPGALYSPSGFLENSQDMFLFYFGEAFGARLLLDFGRLFRVDVRNHIDFFGDPEFGPIAHDHRSFNDID